MKIFLPDKPDWRGFLSTLLYDVQASLPGIGMMLGFWAALAVTLGVILSSARF